MRRQRGASGLFVAVVLILVAAGIIAALAFTGLRSQVEQGGQASATFKIVQDALVQFVAANGRLPCPANPALMTGDADPNTASATCNFPMGTVPWRTLGIRSEDAIDPWGDKISYRVYSGATGLTQAGGASMVNCDTVEPTPAGADALGLCKTTQDTTEAQFLAGKGLTVNAFGTAVADAAYVLVSHGISGLGAWTSAGQQKPMPANMQELDNTTAAGPFTAQAASATGVNADDATHFDDLLAYATIGDLIRRAGAGGRDWPDPASGYANTRIDAPTLAAALGSTPSYGNLGTSTITFTNATATGGDGGGSQQLSFGSSGGEGLGVGGGGSTMMSSVDGEFVKLTFTRKADQLALTLANFGTNPCTFSSFTLDCAEVVDLTFYDGATTLGTISKLGCNADGALATFSVDVTSSLGQFDAVEIRPQQPFPAFPPYDVLGTELLISEFKTCAAGVTCATSLSDATNACP